MSEIKFGTDGWRAIMAGEFTFANVEVVVQGIADYLTSLPIAEQGLVIGHDTRFLAEEFAQLAVEVLTGNGIKVYLINGPSPTPVTAFAIKYKAAAGAIMLTASHNPPSYNGLKFIPEYAGPATPAITKALEERIQTVLHHKQTKRLSIIKAEAEGLLEYIDPKPAYLQHIRQLVDFEAIKQANLTVVVDPMYGAGIGYVSSLLEEQGCDVIAIHEYRDTLFGGSLPEPKESKLGELIQLVKEEKAHLGLANDGDADRFGIIDDDGTYITPNQVITLLLLHLVKNRGLQGAVVRTVATTHLIDAIAQKYNIEVFETPVGFKYVGEMMLKEKVIIGGEESGGLSIYGHIPEKDGILANLLMTELRAKEGRSFKAILAQLTEEFGPYASKRLDLHFEEDKKVALLNQLRQQTPTTIGDRTVIKQDIIDGVKLVFADNAWVLFRPSGTEPLMRVYLETPKGPTDLSKLEAEIEVLIK